MSKKQEPQILQLDELTELRIDYIQFVEKTRESVNDLLSLFRNKEKMYEDHIEKLKKQINSLTSNINEDDSSATM